MRHLKMFVVIGGKFENRKGTEFFSTNSNFLIPISFQPVG